MRYQHRNIYVNADIVKVSGLPAINGRQPELTDVIVTYDDGRKEILNAKDFALRFKPFLSQEDKKAEMAKLCQSIIDQEVLVDDSNSEELLSGAVETARTLLRLIHQF